MLLVQLWSTLLIVSNYIEKSTWLAISTRKTVTTYCNPGVSMSTPPYLHDLFQPIHRQHQHHTRLSNNGVLIPRAHTNMISRSFCYTRAVMWNSLPDDIKAINRESTFRTAVKTFFNNN